LRDKAAPYLTKVIRPKSGGGYGMGHNTSGSTHRDDASAGILHQVDGSDSPSIVMFADFHALTADDSDQLSADIDVVIGGWVAAAAGQPPPPPVTWQAPPGFFEKITEVNGNADKYGAFNLQHYLRLLRQGAIGQDDFGVVQKVWNEDANLRDVVSTREMIQMGRRRSGTSIKKNTLYTIPS
jgi:hypothetical protein